MILYQKLIKGLIYSFANIIWNINILIEHHQVYMSKMEILQNFTLLSCKQAATVARH